MKGIDIIMKSNFAVKPIFTAIIAISILFIALNAIDIVKNVMRGGDIFGYYSDIEDFRKAYSKVGDKDFYINGSVIASLEDEGEHYDFVVKNGELSIVRINYKESKYGKKFIFSNINPSKTYPLNSLISFFEERYSEGNSSIASLFENNTFVSAKNQLFICILRTEYSLEIPDVDKYEFSYNNKPYILYVKHIVAE